LESAKFIEIEAVGHEIL